MNHQDNFINKWTRMHIDPDAREELEGSTKQSWERSTSYNIDYTNVLPYSIPPMN